MYSIHKALLLFFALLTVPAFADLPSFSHWQKLQQKTNKSICFAAYTPHQKIKFSKEMRKAEYTPDQVNDLVSKFYQMRNERIQNEQNFYQLFKSMRQRMEQNDQNHDPLKFQVKTKSDQKINEILQLPPIKKNKKKLTWHESVKPADAISPLESNLLELQNYTENLFEKIRSKHHEIIVASNEHQQMKARESYLSKGVRSVQRTVSTDFHLTNAHEFYEKEIRNNIGCKKNIVHNIEESIARARSGKFRKLDSLNDKIIEQKIGKLCEQNIDQLKTSLHSLPLDAKTARDEIQQLINLAQNQYTEIKKLNKQINIKVYGKEKPRKIPLSCINDGMQRLFNATNMLFSIMANQHIDQQAIGNQIIDLIRKKQFTFDQFFTVQKLTNPDSKPMMMFSESIAQMNKNYKILSKQFCDEQGNEDKKHPMRITARVLKNFVFRQYINYQHFVSNKLKVD